MIYLENDLVLLLLDTLVAVFIYYLIKVSSLLILFLFKNVRNLCNLCSNLEMVPHIDLNRKVYFAFQLPNDQYHLQAFFNHLIPLSLEKILTIFLKANLISKKDLVILQYLFRYVNLQVF